MSDTTNNDEHYVQYAQSPALPTQEAVDGIRYDFNDGARILIPNNGKQYHVLLKDVDTGTVMYNRVPDPITDPDKVTLIVSPKKYFIRYSIQVTEAGGTTPLFEHTFDATGKDVRIQMPVNTLGDAIAWFSYVERFQQKHNCSVTCVMQPHIAEIFKEQYPAIRFATIDEVTQDRPYANYYIGLFFDNNPAYQPVDFRHIGLHEAAAYILGVDTTAIPPRVNLSLPSNTKHTKYVVIATQASGQAKYWNNPDGWHTVIKYLRDRGYAVVCIDKNSVYGSNGIYNHIPWGTIDDTGSKPLQDRINTIKDAACFIGLGSGLSWLAWCCNVPVVLISGFSSKFTEFPTKYRIHNHHVCHSCWNDIRVKFDNTDFFWCPYHKGTGRAYECTREIQAKQVIDALEDILRSDSGKKKFKKKSRKGLEIIK